MDNLNLLLGILEFCYSMWMSLRVRFQGILYGNLVEKNVTSYNSTS